VALADRLPRVPRSIRDLVEPAVEVEATTSCAVVDHGLRERWTSSSVLVRPCRPGDRYGIVGRHEFLMTMTGRYGFGRSIWSRRPVEQLTRWDAPSIDIDEDVPQAAALLSDDETGYSDVIVLEDGRPVGVLHPTTVMAALAAQLGHQAAVDALTGAFTRAETVARLGELCRRVGDGAVVVAFVDLDRMKEVNDNLGHAVGDALLVSVTKRLRRRLAPGDVLGRLGGDEFAVARLLRPCTADGPSWEEQALTLGEELRTALQEPDAGLPESAHSQASVGLAVAGRDSADADHLLRTADVAMYRAKKSGGNLVRLAGSATDPRLSAPWGDDLDIVYQPILSARTGRVDSVEALLRLRRPDGGLEGPAPVLSRAARDGTSLDLDLWVLQRACVDLAAWQREDPQGAPTTVNVNLAAPSLAEPGLAARILQTIAVAGSSPVCVRLELSESASLEEMLRSGAELETLRAAGVRIALDDLGSTLTSLRHVTRLPLDQLKIDRSIVAGMLTDSVDSLIVDVLRRLATDQGLVVVAEGVEEAAQLQALQAAGVGLVQGFLLARPMPRDALRAYLIEHAQDPARLLSPTSSAG